LWRLGPLADSDYSLFQYQEATADAEELELEIGSELDQSAFDES
jgi:hypothetical protein